MKKLYQKTIPIIFLSALLIISYIPLISATELFNNGFETGDFTGWNTTFQADANIVTSPVHHGTYAFHDLGDAQGNSGELYDDFSATPIGYNRAYYQFNGTTFLPNPDDFIVLGSMKADLAGNNCVYLVVGNVDGILCFGVSNTIGGVPTNTYNTSATITQNTWYCTEIMRDVTNGQTSLWIDGVLTLSMSASHSGNNAYAFVGNGYISWSSPTPNYNVYVDCAIFADTYIGIETEVEPTPTPSPTPTPTPTPTTSEPLHENIVIGLVIAFFFVVFSTVFFFFKATFEIILISLLLMAFAIIIGAVIVIPINQIIGIFMIVWCVFAFMINVLRVQM